MSQNVEVLKYLKSASTITPMEALIGLGCFRLAARIHDLREVGHEIATAIVDEDGKKFARYTLIKEKK